MARLLRSLERASFLAAFSFVAACNDPKPREPAPPPKASASPATTEASSRYARPAVPRVVAIGDLHGDLAHARSAMRLAGAVDANDAWIGGSLVVVQTGDEIDRGDDDRAIVDLIERLKSEAQKAGGLLLAMNGNHELMNAVSDFRYVTPKSFGTFGEFATSSSPSMTAHGPIPLEARGRASAFAPGGKYAAILADRPVIAKVGDTLFVHGGVLPKHVAYGIDKINDEIRGWLLGNGHEPPESGFAEDAPVWTRAYSDNPHKPDCDMLDEALRATHAKRLVMGHTVQKGGVNSVCGGKGWRIDVGLSHYYGGPVEILAIDGDDVHVLREHGADAGAPSP